MDQMNAGMKRNQELQTENEATAAKLFAMQHSKQDVRGDIQGEFLVFSQFHGCYWLNPFIENFPGL